MTYRDKLKGFNSTVKYLNEMNYLVNQLMAQPAHSIMDYGCGLGTFVMHLRDMGYDKTYGFDRYIYHTDEPFWFKRKIWFLFDRICFLHSIAHVEDIERVLREMRDNMLTADGQIHVITPNLAWMETYGKDSDWKADETVIRHFNMESLADLFMDQGFKVKEIVEFGTEHEGHKERLYLHASR